MLLINKITLSASTLTVSNKRKRTPSMASITPLLQRIKRSFLPNKTSSSASSNPRRSNTIHCCKSEKKLIEYDEKSILVCTDDTKYYALRLERSMTEKKYTQPVENWWASSPPIQNNHHSRPIMIC